MFKASSLLLLLVTLILNVQLHSSAAIPARVVQTSVVAEEPGPQELAPLEEKESVQETVIPVFAGEASPSLEATSAKEDVAVIVKEPETVLIEDPVSAEADEPVSQESDPQEPLAAAPQRSSEEETVPVEAAFAEAPPGETKVEVAAAAPVESESPDQHNVQDSDPAAPIAIIFEGASEYEAAEENTDKEASPDEMLLIVPDDHAAVEPDASQEPLPSAPEEEKSVVLVPAEPETEEEPAAEEPQEESVVLFLVKPATKEEGVGEPAALELAPEPPVVIVPVNSSEREPEQEEEVTEEAIPIVYPEASKEEASIIVASEEDPGTNEEHLPSTPEVEPVVLVPTEGEAQEETAPQGSAPGEPVVVLVELTSEEPAPEDAIFVLNLEDPEEEAPEDDTEDEDVFQSDPLPEEPALEDDAAAQENEPEDNYPEIRVISVNKTPSESDTIETVLDPVGRVPLAATESLTEVPALVEAGSGTSITTHTEDFIATVILIEDEPVALVNRGSVLGAAFFTLMSFIAIGFVWTTISKKLR